MSEGQQRIENIFKKYITDKKEKFETLEKTNEDILEKLKFIRGTVFNHVKASCPTQTKWLETHGEITYDDKGISVKIYDNIGNAADAVIQEFDVCAQMNDLGLKNFFDEVNSKKSIVFSNNQTCLTKCVYLEKDKTEQDIYNCFDSCFDISFRESDVMFDSINNKISDVRLNLKV
jgi:hypothetical protein